MLGAFSVPVILGVDHLPFPKSWFGSSDSTEAKAFQSLTKGGKPVDAENQSFVEPVAWLDFGSCDLGWLQLDLIAAPPGYIKNMRSGL